MKETTNFVPITPEEAIKKQATRIPDFVIAAANQLIVDTFQNNHAQFTLDELVEKILESAPVNVTRESLFKDRLLDIEYAYREAGWTVLFDKPAYNESYRATFKFKKKE